MEADNGQFDLNKAVAEHSEKKGYAHGVKFFFDKILASQAVRHSKHYELAKKFEESLDDLIAKDSSTALVELVNMFPEFYEDGELPEQYVLEGLTVPFDNISEYLMHLRQLYNLDYYA